MQHFLRRICLAIIWMVTAKSTLAMTSSHAKGGARSHSAKTKTINLAVKLTAIILLAAVLQVSAKGYTQTVTISIKNASLEKLFTEIKKQTGYSFLYTDQMLAGTSKVTIEVKSATIEQVLDICFKNQPLSYTIVNKTVVLKPKDQTPNADATSVDALPLIDISGKVTDAEGNPLQGATVKVKGSNKLTTTNSAGSFVLKGVENDATLEISYVGYEPLSIAVNNKTSFSASLKLDIVTNPEVIINKGYYTEKQKTSVSNTVRVTAAEIEKQPVQNVLLAVQGRVPGLFVTQNSGIAGGAMKVRIQGQNSMQMGSDPLYVVDGVQIDAQMPSTGVDGILGGSGYGGFVGNGNPLNYLNPLDIESVEVLKDADATAIYGSRAANGAILITTKKGKAGEMKFDLNMETGWGKMTRRMDMMNTRQYLDMRYEAFANDGIKWKDPSVSANDLKVWDTTKYTNWQDELLGGTARYNSVNGSISGGTSSVRYLVSGTYHKETTVFQLPSEFGDQKASFHFNLNANNKSQKIHTQLSANYMFDDNQLPQVDFTQAAILLEPNAPPLLNADGSINWAQDANGNSTLGGGLSPNPFAQLYKKYINKTHNLVSSIKLDYTIVKGLNIGSSFGYNYMQTNDFAPYPLIAISPEKRPGTERSAAFGNRNIQSWIIEPQANYHTDIGKGILDLFIGSTFQNKSANSYEITGFGQLSDELLNNINAAIRIGNGISTSTIYKYNALFGRASYNWQDKYILSMNLRRDGSTRFGADNRFHNFGSVGGAWLFSNENFFKNNFEFISFGKLRGNYGTTGSDQVGDYTFMSLYGFYNTPIPYQGTSGLLPTGLPNPGLEWEETKKLQLGIDLSFLKDKLTVTANFIRNRTSNQLLNWTLPSPAGFPIYWKNFPATVQNKNWEFIVVGKAIQNRNFNWTSSINLTIPRNELIEFPGLPNSSLRWRIGQAVDAFPVYHWLGVAEGTGDYLYQTADGHSTTAPSPAQDANIWISKFPKFYGSFQNSISYKSFQLDFIFQFVKQNGYDDVSFWNSSVGTFVFPGKFVAGSSNQPVTVLDRWQKAGDTAPVARYSSTSRWVDILASDRRFADVSYISLKNVSLSYDLPQNWLSKTHFRNLRIYTHPQNLLMLTRYKGLNPETQGITALPPLQVWTIGIMLGL